MAKSVLVTGCTPGGIGHALALEFRAKGFRVFATARKATSIAHLEERGIEPVSLEVTKDESIQALKTEIASRTNGSLDFLINNAGRTYTMPAADIEMDEVRATFETNVFGVMRLCQAFIPLLIKAKGAIVQIGSVGGIIPYSLGSVYNASKAALHSYSDTLRTEVAPFGVRVVTVVTGGVISNIARTSRTLPQDSIYMPIADVYEARLKYSQANGIPNEQYARSVVRQLLGSPSKDTIWEGGKSWLIWYVTFLPRWVMDVAMTRMFQLARLRDSQQKKLA